MVSKEEDKKNQEIRANIKECASIIKSNLSPYNYNVIGKLASSIIKSCDNLKGSELKGLADQIKKDAKTIFADNTKAKSAVDSILSALEKIGNNPENGNKPYINVDPKKIKYTHRYNEDKKAYASFDPDSVENKIITSPVYIDKLHKPFKHGEWKGHLHARLTKNIRIIYLWDKKKKELTFEAIAKHDEQDKS